MNRRQFILLAQAVGLSAYFGEMAFAQAGTLHIRKSAVTEAALADIETLRQGIALLKANPVAMEYASWMYWANSHGTTELIPPEMATVWGQCKHKTSHFLSWHRAFLLFFEALIRELTQVEDFALPYWDWYGSKAIPPVYAEPTLVSGEPNPLYHALRSYRVRTLLMDAFTKSSFSSFQSSLENNPHGSVHVMVGGEMGVVVTAGRDPVFFAHHGNVDRLWNVWLAIDPLHRNPTSSTWLNQVFAYDIARLKSIRVGDILNTEALGYQYDSLTPLGPTALRLAAATQLDVTPARPQKQVPVPGAPAGAVAAGGRVVAAQQRVSVSGESLDLILALPPAMRQQIRALAPRQRHSPQLNVLLEGIHATELGLKTGFEYRVYVNLPPSPGMSHAHSDYYLGVINSFQLGHHVMHGSSLTFELNPMLARLRERGMWHEQNIHISLISDDVTETRPLIEIEHVRLLLVP